MMPSLIKGRFLRTNKNLGVSNSAVQHLFSNQRAEDPLITFMSCVKHPTAGQYKEKTKSGFIFRCKKCNAERVHKSRKEQVKKLKLHFGGKCSKCGYSKYLECLDFHHLDPSEKEFSLSDNRSGKSFKKMLDEASKCALLCCRCHREEHVENFGRMELSVSSARLLTEEK